MERRKELESELRIHLVNLENARSDPNGPSSSGPDRGEEDDEEVQPRQRHQSKGKRRAFDDADRREASNQAYGSTYIARTLPRPEEGFKDKSKGETHKLREAQYSFLSFMFSFSGSSSIFSIRTKQVMPILRLAQRSVTSPRCQSLGR